MPNIIVHHEDARAPTIVSFSIALPQLKFYEMT
jgi:hypothetical protein